MSASSKAYVIGDMFNINDSVENLFTESDIVNLIDSNIDLLPKDLFVGQGIELEGIQVLSKKISNFSDKKIHVPIWLHEKEEKNIVHKHQKSNVLISKPKLVDNETYKNYVCMGNSNLVLDHTTGLHMQAMVLTEAARQTSISVMERWIYGREGAVGVKPILNAMNCKYYKYILPLAIELRSKETKIIKTKNKLDLIFLCEMYQDAELVAEFELDITSCPGERIKRVEHRKVVESLNRMLSNEN